MVFHMNESYPRVLEKPTVESEPRQVICKESQGGEVLRDREKCVQY